MLRRPAHVTRRRVAAHACPECHRLWALRGVRTDTGSWLISCTFCGWSDLRTTGAQRRAQLPAPRATGGSGGRWSHGVLLHDCDEQLVSMLEDHLVSGWAAGAVGLVIATPEHRRALTDRLAQRGLAESLVEGRLVQLDAATTLARFMRDGSPDPREFHRTVGSLVRRHAADAALCAFGEMVDVLWAEGNAVGALELEQLWSGLQDEVPFRLLCAYATAHVRPEDRDTIAAVHEHRLR